MTPRLRLVLFAIAVFAVAPLLAPLMAAMPRFGAHPLPYGDAINHDGVGQRHVTNMVTAVNFDYRSFDTLGEEFMLLAAVTGAVVLLRGARGEEMTDAPGLAPGRVVSPRSEASVLMGRMFAPIGLLYGFYVVLHAQLTPGGGFQGGVIAASALLLLFLSESYVAWRRFMRAGWLDVCEGAGAGIYALAGIGTVMAGHPFLQNTLPLGQTRSLLSGGLILVLNDGVALAVFAGFGLLFMEFLQETRAPAPDGS